MLVQCQAFGARKSQGSEQKSLCHTSKTPQLTRQYGTETNGTRQLLVDRDKTGPYHCQTKELYQHSDLAQNQLHVQHSWGCKTNPKTSSTPWLKAGGQRPVKDLGFLSSNSQDKTACNNLGM